MLVLCPGVPSRCCELRLGRLRCPTSCSLPAWPDLSPLTAAVLLPQRSVFYAALSPLLAFYVLFTALLYPMHASLHLNGFYAATAAVVPAGLHGLLKGGLWGRRACGRGGAMQGCTCSQLASCAWPPLQPHTLPGASPACRLTRHRLSSLPPAPPPAPLYPATRSH